MLTSEKRVKKRKKEMTSSWDVYLHVRPPKKQKEQKEDQNPPIPHWPNPFHQVPPRYSPMAHETRRLGGRVSKLQHNR